ncbi:MAG: SDR family oxidoreductase [Trueperaceae bacterium]|nr:MAG: SDR family oxidoreductase [Trueperaceae bacterium]
MSHSLSGQVALVTGATGGIGSATARQLAEAGAQVVVCYRSSEADAQALAASLPGEGHSVARGVVDDTRSLEALAKQVADVHGRLDILVNNAGVTRFVDHADLDALDDELIDLIFRVNWRGPFAAIRAMKPLLEASGHGLVVNISSIAGRSGNGSNVAYCASKAALDSMTRSLGRALAPAIRVVSVAPGLVEGKYTEKLDPSWSQAQRERTPLGRLASADDVARAVVAVATGLGFSTGCIVPVDGGRPLT